MRKVLFSVLALSALAAVSTTPAEAWGGCGPNRHPTPWGCRWNHGYVGYGAPVVVVGGPVYGWRHRYWGGGPGYGWHHRYWHRHW